MTDELSLQQQQVGNNAVPGLISGAVIGGAGGVATSYWTNLGYKSKADYDKVIKMKEDTFKKQIENAGDNKGNWEKAQEIAKKVQAADQEYETKINELMKSGGVKDSELPQNLVDKRNNAQEALDKLIEQKKGEFSNRGVAIDSKKFPKFDTINTADLPTTNLKTGKPFKPGQVKMAYQALTNEVINAENTLEAKLNAGLRADKQSILSSIFNMHAETKADLIGKSDAQIAEYFAEKEVGIWPLPKTPSKQYKRALDIAEKRYAMPTTLTDKELLEIGQDLEPGKTAPKGYSTRPVKYKAENGRVLYKTIMFEDKVASEILSKKVEQVKQLRTAAADELFAETQKAISINKEYAGLPKRIEKSIGFEKAKATGLYTPASAGAPDKLNITQIISEGDGKLTYARGKGTFTGYIADIQRLEDILHKAKASGTPAVLPTAGIMNSSITAGTTVEDALKQLKARNEVYKAYSKEKKQLEHLYNECRSKNPIIRELNEKIVAEITGNEQLAKAKEALAKQFPTIFGDSAEALSADEIAAKVKELQVVKDAESRLQEANDEIAKYAKEKGLTSELTREKAIEKFGKTKEEYTQKVVEEAKEEFKKISEKLKIKNPVVTSLIGAGALALIGLGIGASQKKTAPVAEEA